MNMTTEEHLGQLLEDYLYCEAAQLATEVLETTEPLADSALAAFAWKSLVESWMGMYQLKEYDKAFHKYLEVKFLHDIPVIVAAPQEMRSFGSVVDGEFRRGRDDYGEHAREVETGEYDRARLMRLFATALPDAENWPDSAVRGDFFCQFARVILRMRQEGSAYLLQGKTDLEMLPDFRDWGDDYDDTICRPPVGEDGHPIFYSVPESFASAQNDGERLRFVVERALAAGNREAAELYADFLCHQFDVCMLDDDDKEDYQESPALREELYQLRENESIALLANGLQKVTLPPGNDYFSLYRMAGCHEKLAKLYLARMQFEKAAEEYRLAGKMDVVRQLEASWGEVEPVQAFYSGMELSAEYSFRNTTRVRVRAYQVDTTKCKELLLKIWKGEEGYYYRHYDPSLMLPTMLHKNLQWFDAVAAAEPEFTQDMELTPLPHHWDTKQTLHLPKLPGTAYLVSFVPLEADGTENLDSFSENILWKSEYFISHENTDNSPRIYVNAPDTGAPIANLPLEIQFFTGYSKIPKIISCKVTTNADGVAQMVLAPNESYAFQSMLVTDLNPNGIKSWYLGNCCSSDQSHFYSPKDKIFMMTDQPIYRPGGTFSLAGFGRIAANRKFWSISSKRNISYILTDPQHKIVSQGEISFDMKRQCFAFETQLPEDAGLGRWFFEVKYDKQSFQHSFIVEEYKKPEYELKVLSPAEAVRLGEPFKVRLQADYYFGAPVVGGKIHYELSHQEAAPLFPFLFRWDWLYDRAWMYCGTTYPDKFHNYNNFEEVTVGNGVLETDAHGNAELVIPTADVLANYGNRNFRYFIKATLEDSTGRMVEASGKVLVASQRFTVSLYTQWGFARPGQEVTVQIAVRTANGGKIHGKGILGLYRRTAKDSLATTPVQTIPFDAQDDEVRFCVTETGTFELKAEVTAEDGTTASANWPVVIYSEKADSEEFFSEELALYTDRLEYHPGETAKVLLVGPRKGMTIYWTVKAKKTKVNWRCLRLKDRCTMLEVEVTEEFRPNVQIMVESVWEAKCHSVHQPLLVPPRDKMLDVALELPRKVQPSTTVPLKLKITDDDGRPASGAMVTVAVYDQALEYLARTLLKPMSIRDCFFPAEYVSYYSRERRTEESSVYTKHVGMRKNLHKVNMYFVGGGQFYSECRCDCIMPESDNAPAYGVLDKEAPDAITNQRDEFSGNIRSEFLDRAFWLPCAAVPEDGVLAIPVQLPDNLTTWRVRVWAITPDTKVGEATTEVVVSKELIVRLELPRLMTTGDTVEAIVNVHNYSERELCPHVLLKSPGLLETPIARKITVPAGGVVDFAVPITASASGEFHIVLSAQTAADADAVEYKVPVRVKGFDKQVNCCGVLDGAHPIAVRSLELPAARRRETTALVLNGSPSLLRDIAELLPYLVVKDALDTYILANCILPACTAKRLLQSAEAALGGRDEFQKPSRNELYMKYMKQFSWGDAEYPVFDPKELHKNSQRALKTLLNAAQRDGGWSWFAGGEESDCDTTAYVVDALLDLYEPGDTEVKSGIVWLRKEVQKRLADKKFPAGDWELDCTLAQVLSRAKCPNEALMRACYAKRGRYSPHGVATLALAFPKNSTEVTMLIRMLDQFWQEDDETETGWLQIPDCYSYFWYGDRNETLAMYLRLLLRNDASDRRVRRVANYLATNLRNSPWRNSSRALAGGVRALLEYADAVGENASDFTVKVWCGKDLHEFHYTPENLWTASEQILFLPAEELPEKGNLEVTLEFVGKGSFYWNAMLNYFSLEDEVRPEGLEMKIRRHYYRLIPEKRDVSLAGVNGSLQKEEVLSYRREPLVAGASVQRGDLVEVELVAEAKNDYDFVVLEDAMPAGFEYEEAVSGWNYSWRVPIYTEYRERGAKFYVRFMTHGITSVVYRMRAQLSGCVSVLPAIGEGVYAKALKCNSDGMKWRIQSGEMK